MCHLVDGRTVVCTLTGERSYDREVGVCRLGGQDVGAAVIAPGLARDCPAYSGGRYAILETLRAASLPLPLYCGPGSLWADPRRDRGGHRAGGARWG